MIAKTPFILKNIYPQLVWQVNTSKKEIFLTFDDGPHPVITPWVIDILSSYNAKATFFCVGENVSKYSSTYQMILRNGHSVGNHTYNHLKGWKSKNEIYFENIDKAASLISGSLFRPPHGRIKFSQINKLKAKYRIIMWTLLTYDFSNRINGELCFKNSISYTKPGTIVVFHDSEKAENNMKYALPRFLDFYSKMGYKFSSLPMDFSENRN